MTGSLGRRLAEIRAGAPDRIDADARALMKRATEELRASPILDGVIVYAEADPDYTVRPEPADVVAAIPGP